jgi:GNAT superfamily N-acetyltransferase
MSANTLTFRLATVEDAEPLERLINAAFRDDKTTQVFLSADHDRIDMISVSGMRDMIAKPECAVLVGTDGPDGAPVTHCSVRKLDADRAWFGLLAVDVGRQGQGLGSQVLAYAERFARQHWGSRRMEFDVVNTRAELRAWYGRRGYQLTGETTPFRYDYHGDWQGVLRDDLEFVNLGKDLDRVDE